VKDEGLSAVDLCQIAYVLFHEVICHAYQGAAKAASGNNAKPQCHWTEGWMDTVAFRIAVRAASHGGNTVAWLPLTGPDAAAAMGDVHQARFTTPTGLKTEDAKIRRAARQALYALQDAFVDSGLANSPSDGEELAHAVSLLANASSDCRTLIRLSTLLQSLLLSNLHRASRPYVANACLEFKKHGSVERLLAELQFLQTETR
jgi:hypothetical protein